MSEELRSNADGSASHRQGLNDGCPTTHEWVKDRLASREYCLMTSADEEWEKRRIPIKIVGINLQSVP